MKLFVTISAAVALTAAMSCSAYAGPFPPRLHACDPAVLSVLTSKLPRTGAQMNLKVLFAKTCLDAMGPDGYWLDGSGYIAHTDRSSVQYEISCSIRCPEAQFGLYK